MKFIAFDPKQWSLLGMHKLQQFLKSYKSCFCAIQFIFQIFFYIWFHTYTSRWSNGGRKIPPPPFSEFWWNPSEFWCQNSNGEGGGKYARFQSMPKMLRFATNCRGTIFKIIIMLLTECKCVSEKSWEVSFDFVGWE